MIVDTFAGPGGWDVGLLGLLGYSGELLGIEWDESACATRAAAGLPTIRADVAAMPLEPLARRGVGGLIGSPPCQAFSRAGKRKGHTDADHLRAHLLACASAGWSEPEPPTEGWADERAALVLEPLRWALALQPAWVALEQVPPVAALWQTMAVALEAHGWHTCVGVLNAADYGVPQTRERAVLLAHRELRPQLPRPTHAQKATNSRARWVSMAEALGWGLTERAAFTFCGGNQGGFDLAGGSQARAAIAAAREDGDWSARPGDDPGTGQGIGSRADAQVIDAAQPPRPSPRRAEASGNGRSSAATTRARAARSTPPGRSTGPPPRSLAATSSPTPARTRTASTATRRAATTATA